MGKKKIRSSVHSKGERSSINRSLVKAVAREKSEVDKALNKIRAWEQGKNPWITVYNPHSTKERYIKVRANQVYGDYKHRQGAAFRWKDS